LDSNSAKTAYSDVRKQKLLIYATVQKFVVGNIFFYVFEHLLDSFCSPRLHLFDENYKHYKCFTVNFAQFNVSLRNQNINFF